MRPIYAYNVTKYSLDMSPYSSQLEAYKQIMHIEEELGE